MAIWNLLRARPLLPTTRQAPKLALTQVIQEEQNPSIPLKQFYPVQLGQVLHDRYQVAAKLGHGFTSTVWLARDLKRWMWQEPRFVAVKVVVSAFDQNSAEVIKSSLGILQLVTAAEANHIGRQSVRTLLDSFCLPGPTGDHVCTVSQPLREPIDNFRRIFIDDKFPSEMLAILAEPILQGLDYLHSVCGVVHCDLKRDNIMMTFPWGTEQKVLLEHEAIEREDPLPQKQLGDRTIYLPHNNFGPLDVRKDGTGRPMIIDLDAAVCGGKDETHTHNIQVDGLQAPEVFLGLPWTNSADIWSLGLVFCELLTDRRPFDVRSSYWKEKFSHAHYMARMISYLGEPPPGFIKARTRQVELFNKAGEFAHPELVDKSLTLESFFECIKENEERDLLVAFLRRMLKWRPEERASAYELLTDPFLHDNRKRSH